MEHEYTDRDGNEGWIGSLYRQELFVPESGGLLIIILRHSPPAGKTGSVKTTLYLNQKAVTSKECAKIGRYAVTTDVTEFQNRTCILELRSDSDWEKAKPERQRFIQLVDVRVENTGSGFAGRYEGDLYIGPRYYQDLMVPANARRLVVVLHHKPQGDSYRAVNVVLLLNQEMAAKVECTEAGEYTLQADIQKFQGTSCVIELRSDNFFIPQVVHNVNDHRLLSIQLIETRVEPASDS